MKFLALAAFLAALTPLIGQQPKPQDTEVWEPVPKIVTPGATDAAPPSDAIVLFDGKNLDEWVSAQDKSPARWIVADGVMTVNKAPGVGNIETKRTFQELPAPHRVEDSREHHRHGSGARQQRRVSRFHGPGRRRI